MVQGIRKRATQYEDLRGVDFYRDNSVSPEKVIEICGTTE